MVVLGMCAAVDCASLSAVPCAPGVASGGGGGGGGGRAPKNPPTPKSPSPPPPPPPTLRETCEPPKCVSCARRACNSRLTVAVARCGLHGSSLSVASRLRVGAVRGMHGCRSRRTAARWLHPGRFLPSPHSAPCSWQLPSSIAGHIVCSMNYIAVFTLWTLIPCMYPTHCRIHIVLCGFGCVVWSGASWFTSLVRIETRTSVWWQPVSLRVCTKPQAGDYSWHS
jgi:hypothetical protein